MQNDIFFRVKGHLVRRPELYHTDTGKTFTYIVIAQNYMVRDEERDSTEGQAFLRKVRYYPLIAWEDLAITAGELKKGALITVEGTISPYARAINGNLKTEIKLIAKTIYLVNGNKMQYYASANTPNVDKELEEQPIGDGEFPLDISEVSEAGDAAIPDPEIPF